MDKQKNDILDKATTAKNKTKETSDEMKDKAMEKIKYGIDELDKIVKDIKVQYDKIDDKTKTKIVAGVAGAAAILGGIIAGKAIKKSLKK